LLATNVMDVLDDGSEIKFEYRFALSQSDLVLLSSTNDLTIDYGSGGPPDGNLGFLQAGPTLGDYANGAAFPDLGLIQVMPGQNGLDLSWPVGWKLQSALQLQGPWTDVVGPTNSYTAPFDSPQKFFRLWQ